MQRACDPWHARADRAITGSADGTVAFWDLTNAGDEPLTKTRSLKLDEEVVAVRCCPWRRSRSLVDGMN